MVKANKKEVIHNKESHLGPTSASPSFGGKSDFFIKRPDEKGRASFSINERTRVLGQKPKNDKVIHEGVAAVNKAFKAGVIDYDSANYQVEQILKALQDEHNKKNGISFKVSDSNMKLLTQYWDTEYDDRKIKRPDSARHRLEWGLAQIGNSPLLGDRKSLQRVVDDVSKGDRRRQRRICSVLNQVRKFFGITQRLRLEKKTFPEFKYLTEDEFRQVLPVVHVGSSSKVSAETYRLLFKLLFGSGARTGEAFALRKDSLNPKNNALMILTQLERGEIESETKNGRMRAAYLMDIGLEAFDHWAKSSDRKYIHRHSIARIFKRACKIAFPYDPSKWITAHDLRHSYAVMMLTKHDVSISQIAKVLGNSVSVCEEYYLRFQANDDLIDSIDRKIHKGR